MARNAMLYRIARLVDLATEARAQRHRSTIAGALHAARDVAVWVADGSDVEKELKAAIDKADQLE